MRGRRRVQYAVHEEHCFFLPSLARVGVALGLASTASRARARARVLGSERGARSLGSKQCSAATRPSPRAAVWKAMQDQR